MYSITKSSLTISFLLFLPFCLLSQSPKPPKPKPLPTIERRESFLGLVDEYGNTVLPFKYDYISPFTGGYASACFDFKCACINQFGKKITPQQYSYIDTFVGDFAVVTLDEKYDKKGVINKEGVEVVPCKYDDIDDLIGDFAIVALNEKYGIINNKKGKLVIPCKYDYLGFQYGKSDMILAKLNGKFGFIDIKEKEIIPLKYSSLGDFEDHRLAKAEIDDKEGFLNEKGEVVIPFIYEQVFSFRGGAAPVKLNGKWGLIDKNGKTLVQPTYDHYEFAFDTLFSRSLNGLSISVKRGNERVFLYDEIDDFSEVHGLALVKKKGKQGFINKELKEVVPVKYDDIDLKTMTNGAWRVRLNGLVGVIDTTGKEVIPIKYDWVKFCTNDQFVATIKGKDGLINKKNEVLLPFVYDDISELGSNTLIVKQQGKFFVITKDGKRVNNESYDSYYNPDWTKKSQLIQIKVNGKSGYINKAGKLVIPPIYLDTFYFSNGYIALYNGKGFGIVDTNHKVIIPFEYLFVESWNFEGGLVALRAKNGKWGYVNKDNKTVVPFIYDQVKGFSQGIAQVCIDYKCGCINEQGQVVVPIKYGRIGMFRDGLMTARNDGYYGYINKNGEVVIPFQYDEAEPFERGRAKVKLNGEEFEIDRRGNKRPKLW